MAFVAGLLPLLSSMGIGGTALATAATVVPAVLGALDVSSGIVQKDPGKAISGALSAVGGGLGAGGFSSAATGLSAARGGLEAASGIAQQDPGKAISGALSAGTSVAGGLGGSTPPTQAAANVAQPTAMLSNAEAISKGLAMPGGVGKSVMIPELSVPGAGVFMQAPGKSMSLADKLGYGLQGASSAASGILGVIQALKGSDASSGSHLGMGSLDTSLKTAGGVAASKLPNIPGITVPGGGEVPTLDLQDPRESALMLELLKAYKA